MPRQSERQRVLNDMTSLSHLMLLHEQAEEDESDALRALGFPEYLIDDDDDDEKLSSQLTAVVSALQRTRYIEPRVGIPKAIDWSTRVLPFLADDRFRSVVRVDRDTFRTILHEIRDHPVFQNNSNQPQRPIEEQLVITLARLGGNGTRSGHMTMASLFGVSEGHIENCNQRVVEAIYSLRHKYIKWPSPAERIRESQENETRQGFRGVVGKVDGSDIVLSQAPGTIFSLSNKLRVTYVSF